MEVNKKIEELNKAMVYGTIKFTNAKTSLANAIISGQQDIAEKITKLATLTGSNNAFYCTFASSYISLFMNVYNRVDAAYKKVLSEGALTKEEFDALKVEQVGITPVTVGWVPWYLWTEDNGINSFYNPIDINLCSGPYWGFQSYTRFTFPDKFYYDSTQGGQDYKYLYLHVPFGSLPASYTPYWIDGLNAYGPFSYEGITGLTYAQFIEAIHTAIPSVSFTSKSSSGTVWYELDDSTTMKALLTNKLSKFGDSISSGFPKNFSSAFLEQFRQGALYINLTDRYNIDHPECYAVYGDALIDDKAGSLTAMKSNAQDSSGLYTGFANVTIATTSEGTTNRPYLYDTDITSSSFGQCYYRIKDFKLLTLTLESTHTLHNMGTYINFPDLVTHNFSKFFNGEFGEDLTVSSLERQVHKYARRQRDVDSAEEIFSWIQTKTSDRPSITDITSKISTFDILVQLADLYSIRYALTKVLLGHFHRINKK